MATPSGAQSPREPDEPDFEEPGVLNEDLDDSAGIVAGHGGPYAALRKLERHRRKQNKKAKAEAKNPPPPPSDAELDRGVADLTAGLPEQPPASADAPTVGPTRPGTPLTREDAAELDALIASLGGCDHALVLIANVREMRAEGLLVAVDGVDIDAVLTRLGGYDPALALITAVRADGAAAAGLTVDEDGRYWFASGERAPHPSHGPHEEVPRRDDGTIDRYYTHDKAIYDEIGPPARRERADGWTPDVQARFVELLADSGSVTHACKAVGRSRVSAYKLRRDPTAREFARAWDEAMASTVTLLAETALDRAVNGQEEQVYHKGRMVGFRIRFDNRLLMAMLRARDPLNYAPIDELERWEGRRPKPEDTVGEVAKRLRLSEEAWGHAPREALPALEQEADSLALPPGRASGDDPPEKNAADL